MKLLSQISLVMSLITCQFVYSQTPTWEWGRYANSNSDDGALDVVVNPSTGESYHCGYFRNDLSGEFTPGVNGTPNMSSPSNEDAFVVKYDTDGNFVWAFDIDGANVQRATGIDIDASGNIYVTGYFRSTTSFQGVTSSVNINKTATGGIDIFLAKYDSNGNLLWVVHGGSIDEAISNDVDVNDDGVFITGWYLNSLLTITDGMGGIDNTTLIAGGDQRDAFVAGFNHDGTTRWLRRGAGSSSFNDRPYGITSDGTHVYIVGTIAEPCTFYDPVYGNQVISPFNGGFRTIFLAAYNEDNGGLIWTERAGTVGADGCEAHGIHVYQDKLYFTGGIDDDNAGSINFPGLVPFGLPSSSGEEIFICQLDTASRNADWVNYEINNSPVVCRGEDVTVNTVGEIIVTGYCRGTTTFGGNSIVSSGAYDLFVSAYDNTGAGLWVEKAQSTADDVGNGISVDNNGSIYIAGTYEAALTISPQPLIPYNNQEDAFFGKILPCQGPTITTCQTDVTVIADAACNHTLGDYTGAVIATDDCGAGLTISQVPAAGTILTAGQHNIALIATDPFGLDDTCFFNLTIEAAVNPIIVNCGDLLAGQSTLGNGNNQDTWTCSPDATPGEDIYYQITVPAGNYLLGTQITNASDINENKIHVRWVSGSCPTTTTCLFADEYNINQGDFDSNNQNQLLFNAIGPGTYWFVVDAVTDHIDSYDIEFNCIVSGVEFDEDGCGSDIDNNGVYTTVDGGTTLKVEPCQTSTFCHETYIQNINAGEWMDTVLVTLGPCYTNVTNFTPDGPALNGFHTTGVWNAVYDAPNNQIEWGYDYQGGPQLWGDGPGAFYNCATYEFCFDAEIATGCIDNDSLKVNIYIEDDAVDGAVPGVAQGFDYAFGDSLSLLAIPDPSWDFNGTTSWCQSEANPIANITGTAGGTFSSTAGLVWADQPNGEIDLAASTPGNYNITYAVGLCPFDSLINITINAEEDPFFDYPQATYCQSEVDPVATNVVTAGGTFSGPAQVVFLNTTTGLIDLSASTLGGPYTIKYVTPGICPDSSTFDISINTIDDPFFDYPQTAYCQGDADPIATNVATGGGTFSGPAGVIFLNTSTGLIDLSASTSGGPYTIKYVTAGPCPDSTTFDITINPEDDPSFSFNLSYCQSHADPTAIITGTLGGTFSGPAQVVFLNTTTGLIDLSASTAGGPYTIKYVTPGACPDSSTVNITINADDDPFFDYPQAAYCQGDIDPVATNIVSAGGTFSGPAGIVFSNTSTGQIDLSASTVGGPYAIKYVTAGVCPDSTTFNITINAEDDPTFTYTASYCQSDANPIASLTGTPGGTFSGPAQVVFLNTSTGLIDLSASTVGGPYAIKYVTAGICPDSMTFNITINADDDPFFDYPQVSYCQGDADPLATNVATVGGTFSGPVGVVFLNASTGLIDLSASTSGGPYAIKYVTGGVCPDSTTFNLTINAEDDPFFDYPQATYCQSEVDPVATNVVTAGGTFSGPAQVVFLNTSTGLIDLSASTVGGPYAIKYVTAGICPDSMTFNITINADDDPFFDYANVVFCNNDAVEDTLSVGTSGGTFSASSGMLNVNGADGQIDPAGSTPGTYQVYYTTPGPACPNVDSIQITINAEDDPSINYATTVFCNNDADEDTLSVGTSGGTFSTSSVSLVANAINGQLDISSSIPGNYQVYYTTPGPLCPNIDSVLITINAEDDPSLAYANTTFCNNDSPEDTLSVGTSGGTFSASSILLNVNGADGQITPVGSSPGVYQVYYTTPGPACPNVDSVQITINAEDDASLSYANTIFCNDDANEDTLAVGTNGGVFFASSLDLVVNSITGQLDISSSVPATYQVYYQTPGPLCPNIDSVQILINAEDDPSFNYGNVIFCNAASPEDTVSTATPGGTFSASSILLSIDAASGQITPTTSTPGVFQVYYTTPGPACPNIDSVEVTVNAEDDPSFAFPGTTYCVNAGLISPSSITTPGGSWGANSTDLDINLTSGDIDISNSTAGTYTIYHVTNGICPNIDSLENFVVNPMDDDSFTYSTPICAPGTNPVAGNVALPGGTFSEVTGNVNFANVNTGEIDLLTSNSGVWLVDYLTNGICPSTGTFSIEILPAIDPVFWLPDSVCADFSAIDMNDSTNLQIGEQDLFYSYGLGGSATLSGINNNNIEPFNTAPGIYQVTHVVTSNLGCIDSSTLQIEVIPTFNATFINPDTLCQALGVYDLNQFFDSFTDSGGQWSGVGVFNDSLWNAGSLPSGNYDLSYIVGIGFCTDTMTATIHLKEDLDSSWTLPADMCTDGTTFDLDTYVTGTGGGIWSGVGIIQSTFDPGLAGAGTHAITYTVDGFTCSESFVQSITVYEAPVSEAGLDDEICDSTFVLDASSNIPGIGYWIADNEGSFWPDSSFTNAEVTVSTYGTHKFYWYMDQSGVCSAIDSVEITFDEQPLAEAGPDQNLDFLFETNFQAIPPNVGMGEWSLVDGSGNIWSIDDPTSNVSELQVGTNEFMWTVVNGSCPAATDNVRISINDIWVPEVLTPNGDGFNDYFEIKGIENAENHVQIFNRWGQLVFEQNNYENDWEGYSNSGVMLEEETYFYIIKVQEDRIFNGYIVLKR